LYAILFLVGSYWQMREQRGNIGHDAHLGGAVIGLLVATAMYPHIVRENTLLYGAVLVISLGLFVHLVWNPFHLPGRRAGRRESDEPGHPRYSTAHLQAQREVDRILEKVAQTGLHSLTPEEQKILNREADKLRGREGR
jgi:hypothetical protein